MKQRKIRTCLILVRSVVQSIEAECSTASENVVDPATPVLEVVGTTLANHAKYDGAIVSADGFSYNATASGWLLPYHIGSYIFQSG